MGKEKYSGLLDVAMEGGYVEKPSPGWYQKKGTENKVREKETLTEDFWQPIFDDTNFKDYVKNRYSI